MYVNQRMPIGQFKSGTLANAAPLVVDMKDAPLPCTITLNSADAGRLIRLGTNGAGGEFATPAVTVTSATMQIVVVTYPISHIELTGAAADTWNIR